MSPAMALEEQIIERAKEIHADGYPMSIGEVMSMYRDGDIEIHPEFQRIFRWESGQKSLLIEINPPRNSHSSDLRVSAA
jgi:hypothetical protein